MMSSLAPSGYDLGLNFEFVSVTRPRGIDPRLTHGAKRILVAVGNKGVTHPCLLFIEVALAE